MVDSAVLYTIQIRPFPPMNLSSKVTFIYNLYNTGVTGIFPFICAQMNLEISYIQKKTLYLKYAARMIRKIHVPQLRCTCINKCMG